MSEKSSDFHTDYHHDHFVHHLDSFYARFIGHEESKDAKITFVVLFSFNFDFNKTKLDFIFLFIFNKIEHEKLFRPNQHVRRFYDEIDGQDCAGSAEVEQ